MIEIALESPAGFSKYDKNTQFTANFFTPPRDEESSYINITNAIVLFVVMLILLLSSVILLIYVIRRRKDDLIKVLATNEIDKEPKKRATNIKQIQANK